MADLKVAIDKKDIKRTTESLAKAHDALQEYRVIAMIDQEDGGVVELPAGEG